MNLVKRVVLDTSTLVSAALRVDSIPSQVLLKVLRECEMCASEATLQELATVMLRPKFDRYLARDEREKFVELIRTYSVVWKVRDEVQDCRDPQDNKFLALALVCEADVLVSSDDDLLALNPYRDIPVLTPKTFFVTRHADKFPDAGEGLLPLEDAKL